MRAVGVGFEWGAVWLARVRLAVGCSSDRCVAVVALSDELPLGAACSNGCRPGARWASHGTASSVTGATPSSHAAASWRAGRAVDMACYRPSGLCSCSASRAPPFLAYKHRLGQGLLRGLAGLSRLSTSFRGHAVILHAVGRGSGDF